MKLSEKDINKFFENIHNNKSFINLSKHCAQKKCEIEICFQLDKPIKKTLAIWLFIVIYNENGQIYYNDNSGEGEIALLEDVLYGFYNLKTKMIEKSETFDLDINEALVRLNSNLEFVE